MITGKVIKGQQLPADFKKFEQGLNSAVEVAVLRLAVKLTGLVKQKLSGEVLKVQTGRLRRSIHYELEKGSNRVDATVGTNVKYAATHELGLTIPQHIVEARNAKALRFEMAGKTIFAKRVTIPQVRMPQRSFLRASLDEMSDEIKTELQKAVQVELDKIK